MTKYDLSIVGGGIIGLWVARLALKHNPHHRILILDQSLIGHGVTQYSLGLNYLYGDTTHKKELSQKSSVFWEDLFQEEPMLFCQKRPLYVFLEENLEEKLRTRFSKTDFYHCPTSVIESFQDNHPWFKLNEKSDVFYGDAAQIPADITGRLVHLLKQEYLIDIYEGMKLVELSYVNEEINLGMSTGDQFQSEKLILSMGPWMASFLKEVSSATVHFGEIIKSRYTKKIVSLHFDYEIEETDPIFFWPNEPAFLVPNASTQQWILSIKSESKTDELEQQALFLNEQDTAKGFSFINKHAPGLKEHFRGGRVFCDLYQNDQDLSPLLIQGFPHAAIVGAGAGIGFRLAPGIAYEALEAIDYF